MLSRRSVLASSLAVTAAGCISPVTESSDADDELPSVEEPPSWLHQDVDCYPKGSLELSELTDSVNDSTAVADYDDLSADSKLVVRFAAQHGAARTCVDAGATAFGRLLGDLMDHATDPYRETHDERPPSIAIRAGNRYYPINEMTAYDQVLV